MKDFLMRIFSWCLLVSCALFTMVISPCQANDANKKSAKKSATIVLKEDTSSPYGYMLKKYIKPVDENQKVPLLIHLHGAAGVKKGAAKMGLREDEYLTKCQYSCLFVKPAAMERWDADKLDLFIEVLLKEYSAEIDPSRIYIMGHSMGGYGSWLYCMKHGDKIAAMIASAGGFIRGTGPLSKYSFHHFKDLPVMVFHNTGDKVVPVKKAKELIASAKAAGGSPIVHFYDIKGHKYDATKVFTKENVDWLFAQNLKSR